MKILIKFKNLIMGFTSLNKLRSDLKPKKFYLMGFTMIELLVAISVFSIIVAITSGIFISSIRSSRLASALISANTDASLTMDQMSRMIRKGFGRSFSSETKLNPDGQTVDFKCLRFKYGNDYVTYRWNRAEKSLEWNTNTMGFARCDTGNFSGIISENLIVESADFSMRCNDNRLCYSSDTDYPRITVLLRVGTKKTQISQDRVPVTNLETTISPRNDLRY